MLPVKVTLVLDGAVPGRHGVDRDLPLRLDRAHLRRQLLVFHGGLLGAGLVVRARVLLNRLGQVVLDHQERRQLELRGRLAYLADDVRITGIYCLRTVSHRLALKADKLTLGEVDLLAFLLGLPRARRTLLRHQVGLTASMLRVQKDVLLRTRCDPSAWKLTAHRRLGIRVGDQNLA